MVAGGRKVDIGVQEPSAAVSESDEYEPLIDRANREKTEVLLVFGAKWCVWCQKFTRDVMPNQRIASRLAARNAAVVKVDVDKRRDVAERYGVKSLPTMVLVDSEGREIRRMSGFASVREFLAWVE